MLGKCFMLFILTLVIGVQAIAQTKPDKNYSIVAYDSLEGVQLLKAVSPKQLCGFYEQQGGSHQFIYLVLDTSGSFTVRANDCLTGRIIKKGKWTIAYARQLKIQDSQAHTLFDILHYRGRYFLVEPSRRTLFIQLIKNQGILELQFYSKKTES